MSPRPRRSEQIENLQEAVKTTAWKQIAESGAPTLRLRAIARELGITAPAIYNYFPDRDALVTALIIDAYLSFGNSQIAACNAVPAEDLAGRLTAIGLAYRKWALAYPQRYQLIFGTPIPGYEAPHEQVLPSAARSLSALLSVVDDLRTAEKLNAVNFPKVEDDFGSSLEIWKEYGDEYDILSLSVAVLIWARVHGLVSLEISQNLPPFGEDGNVLFQYEIEALIREFVKQ